jgi:hypothetical protein
LRLAPEHITSYAAGSWAALNTGGVPPVATPPTLQAAADVFEPTTAHAGPLASAFGPARPVTPQAPVPAVPASLPHEPESIRGLVFEHFADGHNHVLAQGGQTTPDPLPGQGPTIPDSDVRGGRVVMYVDGILQGLDDECYAIGNYLQSPLDGGSDVGQPVVAIHEGSCSNPVSEVARITRDVLLLKEAQLPGAQAEHLLAKSSFDPAVKSIHDEVRQSLLAGRTITLVAFSGGGEEAALALELLSKEEGGRFADAIHDQVRILALSPAAAKEDFFLAGVRPDNLYITASRRDPLVRYAHHFIDPTSIASKIAGAIDGIDTLLHLSHKSLDCHSPSYIFEHSQAADGSKPIDAFLAGGPGGEYLVD